MSYDPSKIEYHHEFSKSDNRPLEILTFVCNECKKEFFTKNELAEHHLDRHSSIPLDLSRFKAEEHQNGKQKS